MTANTPSESLTKQPSKPEANFKDSRADKLRAVALYQQDSQGIAGIARNLGRSRAAVTAWINLWKRGGAPALLAKPERAKTEPYRFSNEARQMLLERARKGEWKTCRDAWRWVKEEQGVDVCYLTVWRFLSQQGLFEGATMHARTLTGAVPKQQAKDVELAEQTEVLQDSQDGEQGVAL
jgi:transposase